jgi:hypothetical protein
MVFATAITTNLLCQPTTMGALNAHGIDDTDLHGIFNKLDDILSCRRVFCKEP